MEVIVGTLPKPVAPKDAKQNFPMQISISENNTGYAWHFDVFLLFLLELYPFNHIETSFLFPGFCYLILPVKSLEQTVDLYSIQKFSSLRILSIIKEMLH